jgi:hypothetical protein
MAGRDKAKKEREKAKFAAMEGLRPRDRWPVPPRKATSRAKKASKRLPYPLAPYLDANPLQLYRWAGAEWKSLGRWQSLALPVIVLVGLLTWEKEKALQEAYRLELEKAGTRQYAARLYGAFGPARRRRKLFGIIPLPGGRN